MPPARLEMPPCGDRRPTRHDVAVGALQCIEADFEPQSEETPHLAEEVVGGGGQQVDVRGEVSNGREQVNLERAAVGPIAELDPRV